LSFLVSSKDETFAGTSFTSVSLKNIGGEKFNAELFLANNLNNHIFE
jgi:hypothetical protein